MNSRALPPLGHPQEDKEIELRSTPPESLLLTIPVSHQSTYPTTAELSLFERCPSVQSRVLQITAQPLDGLGQSSSSVLPRTYLNESTLIPPPPSPPPYTSNLHSTSLSLVPLQRNRSLEVLAHPQFEEIVKAIFYGRQIGEDLEKQRALCEQHRKTRDCIYRARMEFQSIPRSTRVNQDLDLLMRSYLKLVQGLNRELTITQNEASTACAMFEQQIRAITNSATRKNLMTRHFQRLELTFMIELEGPIALSSSEDDHLKNALKRKFGPQIRQLNDEFHHKTKKGKLPPSAIEVLRNWWDKNVFWPYPSEDEKVTLAEQTDLNATQINNWFINQRKRHWHKFFKDGRLPQSPQEATEILKNHGLIP
eukprot:g8605.t1